METFQLGDVRRTSHSFTSLVGVALDPTEVYFQYQRPGTDVTVTLHYGVDGQLFRTGVGEYYVDMNCDTAGIWYGQWRSTGGGESCEEAAFYCAAGEV